MEKFWLVIAAMIMALTLGNSGVMASTITFDGDHALTITLFNGLTPIYPTSATVSSGVQGTADYPNESNSANDTKTFAPGATTTATANASPVGTYLHTGNTHTTLNADKTTGLFYRYFTGYGPNTSGVNPGYITQANADTYTQTLHLAFTGLNAGTYTFSLADLYSSTLGLTQAGGNSVYSLEATAALVYYVYYSPTQFLSSSALIQDYSKINDPNHPIPGFTLPSAGTATAGQVFTITGTNKTITADITLSSRYEAYTTPIPVPPSAILLGSGLLGLALLGRRKFNLKK
jgi:hypothetical protein